VCSNKSRSKVSYDGQVIGEYFTDLLVEGRIIVELKASQFLTKEHEVQLVNYLNATEVEHGLLLNFGSSVQAKRKFRTYRPSPSTALSIL